MEICLRGRESSGTYLSVAVFVEEAYKSCLNKGRVAGGDYGKSQPPKTSTAAANENTCYVLKEKQGNRGGANGLVVQRAIIGNKI